MKWQIKHKFSYVIHADLTQYYFVKKSFFLTCDFSRGLMSSSSDELPVYDATHTQTQHT